MKKFCRIFIILFLVVAFAFVNIKLTYADQIDDLGKQISDLTQALNQSVNATKPLQSQLDSMQKQISDIKAQVANIEVDIANKKIAIDTGYKELDKQTQVLNRAIRDFYIQSYSDSPLLILLSNNDASHITQVLAYQKAATDEDKIIITNIALAISDLQTRKKNLENEEARLTVLKADLDQQSAKLDTVIQGAVAYQAKLSSQIAQLSAQQQALIAQKQASLNIPQSAYTSQHGCVDDRGVDPGFSPRFALFTYGVPNRVGLNQYGAWGRAKAGESAEQILADYYPGLTLKKDYDQNVTINVDGNGSMSIEEYVRRIYEMPDSWTDNGNAALMAQAVAARSYGLAHKSGICTTDSCQVFQPNPKGGNWDTAANATRGWVLVDGSGNPVSTQYSSTHGGYIINIPKFDGEGGNPTSFADLNARAYDGPSHANSPWFYCDWGARPSYSNTAWLQSGELADIVNIILLAKTDSSTINHLYQPDVPNPAGTDTWDAGRVKQELQNRGGHPFSSISSASVSVDFGSGKTTSVNFSGDAGSQSFDASEFKSWFNLRAPANIQIVGPLYNVEQK